MKNLIRLLSLGFILSLCSCAAMKQQWVDTHCAKEDAYAEGMNAARSAKPMDVQGYSICSPDSKDAIMASYREGYENGLKEVQASTPTQPTTIIIQGNMPSHFNHRENWRCQVDAWGTYFDATGTTKEEAQARAEARFENEACTNPRSALVSKTMFSNCSDRSVMHGFANQKMSCVPIE